MTKHCILHIGPMKTGSTAIQYWMTRNRQKLLDAGIAVPSAFPSNNHSEIAVIADQLAAEQPLAPRQAELLAKLRAELAALPEDGPKMLISGELMAQRLRTLPRVRALRDILAPYFTSFEVVIYLRRQDQQAISLYSTAVRRGEKLKLLSEPVNYADLLKVWADVFGHGTIKPRIYERGSMPGGNVVADFAEVLGLDWPEADLQAEDRNTSLLPEAQEFLIQLAAATKKSFPQMLFREMQGYNLLIAALNRHFSGRGIMPLRQEAAEYYERIRGSNAAVCAEWFPGRERLFSEDFSNYPEVAPPPVPEARLFEVAMRANVALLNGKPGPVQAAAAAARPAAKPQGPGPRGPGGGPGAKRPGGPGPQGAKGPGGKGPGAGAGPNLPGANRPGGPNRPGQPGQRPGMRRPGGAA